MLTTAHTISEANQAAMIAHLEEHVRPLLVPDVSNYAAGRMRVWLQAEAPLAPTRPWAAGLKDDRLWRFCKAMAARAGVDAEVGLVSLGGSIERHRDAGYAEFRAVNLNLGEARFDYEVCYQGFEYDRSAPKSAPVGSHHLRGGEVLQFNCKNPHAAESAEDRWAVQLWGISKKERARYTKHMIGS